MTHRFDNMLKSIINIIKNDYAGFDEKKEKHDSRYFVNTAGTAWKKGILDEMFFLRIVCQYLATLGDPNLKFSMVDHDGYQNYDVGFRARRYGEYLYVTEVGEEKRLAVGDRILKLNTYSAGMHKKKFGRNFLVGEISEREQWGGILKMVKHIMVEHADGTTEDMELTHFPKGERKYALEFTAPADGVCCLKIESFAPDTSALEALLKEHEGELASCRKLIIDLRKNEGGSDEGFIPLLPYVMDEPFDPYALLDAEPVMNNYTEANCSRKAAEFGALKSYYETVEGAGDTVKVLDGLINDFKAKAGSGWMKEDEKDRNVLGETMEIRDNIKSVVIITDTWCRDSGEAFVDIARGSSKVKLVGRPTMGTIDYTNPVTVVFDETYVLTYPMGKRACVTRGKAYSRTGIPVDTYISWKPEECTEDVLIKKALES